MTEAEAKYIVYKHVAPNGKIYIGMTSTTLSKRWFRGKGYKQNKPFFEDINAFGWDNIAHSVVRRFGTKEEATTAEKCLIRHYQSFKEEHGYNIACGGSSAPSKVFSVRRKIGDAHIGFNQKTRGTCKNAVSYKIDISESEIEERREYNGRKKSVLCVETGQVYRSVREAAREHNLSHTGISRVCNEIPKYITCGGYHWKYVEAS